MESFLPFALAILATIVFAAIGTLIVRCFVTLTVSDGHNVVLVPIFQTAGTVYAVFLAFLVVAVWQSYDGAHDNVAEEASALTTLYRASAGMEQASGAALRGLIRTYTHAVVEEEWPVQAAAGGTSQTARAAALAMFRLFQHLPAEVRERDVAIDGALLSILTQVMADRNKRTLEFGRVAADDHVGGGDRHRPGGGGDELLPAYGEALAAYGVRRGDERGDGDAGVHHLRDEPAVRGTDGAGAAAVRTLVGGV